MASLEYNATVSQRIEVAPGLIILRIAPDGPLFTFEAGQYGVLGLRRSASRAEGSDPEDPKDDPDRMIRRAYSIASSSKADEYIEFYVTLVRSGELTPRLFCLQVRDRVYLGPKATGLFTLNRVPEDRHVILVATGTGLAPYMSMLRTDLVYGGPRLFVVLHGARYSWDLGYRNELSSLARICPSLVYIPAISRPQDDPTWKGPTGYVQDVMLSGVIEERTGLAISPDNFHVFLCGNPSMIEDARDRLVQRGFKPDERKEIGNIHVEEYW